MLTATLPISTILAILFSHWLADFVGQSDEMAKNKSTSNFWLLVHIAVYGSFMSVMMVVTTSTLSLEWLAINLVLHGITDYFTSRLNTRLWKAGEVHWFFVSVGFDQLIHMVTLLVTAAYLF